MDKILNNSLSNISSDNTQSKNAIPFDLLAQENEVGIFYLNNSDIVYANDAFIKILGISAERAPGFSILEAIIEEDRKVFENGLQQMINGEKDNFSCELQLRNEESFASYLSLHLRVNTRSEGRVTLIGASGNATKRVKRFQFRKSKTSS